MESVLSGTDTYRTEDARLGRALWPSWRFYRRALSTVWRASSLAKRGRYDDVRWNADSLAMIRYLEAAGVRVEVTGGEHLRAMDGPCVFIGNHMSTLETFVLPTLILPFSRVTFVVKRSLVEYPVFRHIMRSREPVTVRRVNPRDDLKVVLAEGPERLGRGLSVVVFPQTTRSLAFDPTKFNSIGVKLAKRARVPVLPVAIRSDAWGNGRLIRDLGPVDPSKEVHIAFGAPCAVEGRGGEEHERVIAFIEEHVRRWGVTVARG